MHTDENATGAEVLTMDVIVEGKKMALPEPDARALIAKGQATPARVEIVIDPVEVMPKCDY